MLVGAVVVSNIVALGIAVLTEMRHKEVAKRIKERMNYAKK